MANLALQPADHASDDRYWPVLQRRTAVYALSLSLVAIAFLARALLAPTLGDHLLYLFLVPSVLIAGVVGGLGPGLLATTLCLALHLYISGEYFVLINPASPLFAAELTRAATFSALGAGIAWFGERLRATRLQSGARQAHLESILATVPDAMIVIDEHGSIRSFSS